MAVEGCFRNVRGYVQSIFGCVEGRLKVTLNNEHSEQWQMRTQSVHADTQRHTCVSLDSLHSSAMMIGSLHWTDSTPALPFHSGTVRNHLVSLGLLQSNWPFKEGLHHVKQCNWEWYSLLLHSPFCPLFLYPCIFIFYFLASPLALPRSPGQLLSVCRCLSTSCSCCTLSSADSGWPLRAPCCNHACYHFQHWTAPGLGRANFILKKTNSKAIHCPHDWHRPDNKKTEQTKATAEKKTTMSNAGAGQFMTLVSALYYTIFSKYRTLNPWCCYNWLFSSANQC